MAGDSPSAPPGTAFQGPEGQLAVRMGPGVTAGEFFVIHPDNGGHYASGDEVADWNELKPVQPATPKAAKSSSPTPAATPAPPSTEK